MRKVTFEEMNIEFFRGLANLSIIIEGEHKFAITTTRNSIHLSGGISISLYEASKFQWYIHE